MNALKPSPHGTAVITGASAGIGKVYADRLAARGYDLLLVARRGSRLEEISEDLQSRCQIRVEPLVADLAHPDGLSEVVKRIAGDSSITFLVNNAGTAAVGPLTGTSLETLNRIVAVNITALSALTLAVLPGFQKRNIGTIVNIGSSFGYNPNPIAPIYGPTKAYVFHFTRALQKELAGSSIRVHLVTPAATLSEIWDIAGYPLSNMDPATVMTTENCVDAALCGLDMGELITSPSLQDNSPLESFQIVSETLFHAMRLSGQPAPRYGVTS